MLLTYYEATRSQGSRQVDCKCYVALTTVLRTNVLHCDYYLAVTASKNVAKFQDNLTLQQFKVIQGHRSWCQCKAHM